MMEKNPESKKERAVRSQSGRLLKDDDATLEEHDAREHYTDTEKNEIDDGLDETAAE